MKAIKLFSMAALAFVIAACSSDDNEIEQQPAQQQAQCITFKAILAAPNCGETTRTTFTESGTAINVAWRAKEDGVYEGDKIALLHNGVKDIATVTAVDGSGNATIEATITGSPTDNDDVVLVYPAASVNTTGSGTGFTPDETYAAKQLAQDGSLEFIAQYLDGREGNGKLSVPTSGTASLKANVTMASKIAVWYLELNNASGTEINPTVVKMKLGSQTIAQAALSGSSNHLYMCVVPKLLQTLYDAASAASLPTPVFCIEATVGTTTYTYPVFTALSLAISKYYQSTVNMGTLGDIMGSNGKFYANGAAVPAGAKPIGVLAYIGDDATTEPTFGCGHGLVLCLKNVTGDKEVWSYDFNQAYTGNAFVTDLDDLKRTTGVSGYAATIFLANQTDAETKYRAVYKAKNYTGLTAPTGSMGWFLPSAQQWVKMQTGLGGLDESAITWNIWYDNSHTAVNEWEAALEKAGSGNYDSMKGWRDYWTSSEKSGRYAISMEVDATGIGTNYGFNWNQAHTEKELTNFVRPILAF